VKSIFDYSAAIFDLDGTLADSMHIWEDICPEFLRNRGIEPPEGLKRTLGAMRMSESAPYIIREFKLDMSVQQVIGEWQQMALHQYESTVLLKDGALELLKKLSAKGIKLAVATSCFPAACEAVLRGHGVRDMFSVIAYSDDMKLGKAFPDIWIHCAEKLGAAPPDCVVVEDFPAALSGVRAAGMDFVAVYENSFHEDWQDFSAKADIAVKSLRELL